MTYWLAPGRRVVLLTVFVKSRLEGGGTVPTFPVLDRLAAAMGMELAVTFEPAAV